MKRLGATAVVLALLCVPASAASAAGTGTVGVAVNSPTGCVTVSGSFNYGTLGFSTLQSAVKSTPTGGPSIANCAGTPEQFVAHVTNLTGSGNASWSPIATGGSTPCPTADTFGLNVSGLATGPSSADLTGVDAAIGGLNDATPYNWVSILTMPCTGSGGAGVPMSGSIIVTASLP